MGNPTQAVGSRGRRLLAMFFGLGLALLLAELSLRHFAQEEKGFQFRSNFPAKSADDILVQHPTRFYSLRPNRRINGEHAGRYACDAWPFRGRPPNPAPSANSKVGAKWPRETQHVLVLGDSCVFGQGLDVGLGLPAQIEELLRKRGFGVGTIQVTNLGVPGYSLVQVRRLLEETLREVKPAVVVLYPGAWNDQAVALARSDVELDRETRSMASRSAVLSRLRRWVQTRSLDKEQSAARLKAFEEGSPSIPRRVPLDAYLALLEEIRTDCEAVDSALVVIAPAHPQQTAVKFPMTREYAGETLRWAREMGLGNVDGQAELRSTGLGDETLFLDFVHPSAPAMRALAEPVAELLTGLLEPATASPSSDSWTCLNARLSSLGDELIRFQKVSSEGGSIDFQDGDQEVAVSVGSAPLFDLRVTEDGHLEGRSMANAPGVYPVLVWTAQGWQETGASVELLQPALVFESQPSLRLVATSRAQDQILIRASPVLRDQPDWNVQGAHWLGQAEQLEQSFELTCDQFGRAVLDLEPFREQLTAPLFAQALVLPHGAPREESLTRTSGIAEIRLP